VIRPVAAEYDRAQELPWPILQEAARQGLYGWELYAELSVDPTGLSLPILMEELFWGCAGIGLSIVMPALALAAIRQAATDEQLGRWAPECFGTPEEIKLAALAVTEPSGGSDVRSTARRCSSATGGSPTFTSSWRPSTRTPVTEDRACSSCRRGRPD
jgi:acyl-CoA dehydrogenase